MNVNRVTLEWYELLARGLIWASGIVLLLAVIGAVVIAGSDNAIPVLEDAERQGRGIAALASLGIGLTSAGLLGGLGALLRLQVADRLAELGPRPEEERDEPDDKPGTPATPTESTKPAKAAKAKATKSAKSAKAAKADRERRRKEREKPEQGDEE